MDILTISNAGGLGADYQGQANLKRRVPREDQFTNWLGTPQPDNAPEAQGESRTPAASPAASSVAKDLAANLPPLGRQQAQEVIAQLAPMIAQTHPWKLAEIQAVSDRSLIPSAYV